LNAQDQLLVLHAVNVQQLKIFQGATYLNPKDYLTKVCVFNFGLTRVTYSEDMINTICLTGYEQDAD